MKRLSFLASLTLLPSHAAVLSLDDAEAFGGPEPTEILDAHRKKQNKRYSMVIPGDTKPITPINSGIWDLNNKNPQAYDWFQAGNTLSPDLDAKLASLGTPIPEPTGNILFGFAGLAFALLRKR